MSHSLFPTLRRIALPLSREDEGQTMTLLLKTSDPVSLRKTQSPSRDPHRPPQACSCSSNMLAPLLLQGLCFRTVAFAGKLNSPTLSFPRLLPVSVQFLSSQWGSAWPVPPVPNTYTPQLAPFPSRSFTSTECTVWSAFLVFPGLPL